MNASAAKVEAVPEEEAVTAEPSESQVSEAEVAEVETAEAEASELEAAEPEAAEAETAEAETNPPEGAESTQGDTDAGPAQAAEPESDAASDRAVHPDEHLTVSRLTVARLALPKLSMPKFGSGRTAPDDDADAAPDPAAETAETAETAEAEPQPDPDPELAAPGTEPEAKAEPDPEATAAPEPEPEPAVDPPQPDDTKAEPKLEADPAPKTGSIKVVAPKTGAINVVSPKTGAIAVVAPRTGAIKVVAPKTGAIKVVSPKTGAIVVVPKTGAVDVVAPKTKVARSNSEVVLLVEGLTKRYDDTVAVNGIDLEVKIGSFYGIVGPNGAGKTTTLSMITGLLRPDAGSVAVHGADVWSDPVVAKRNMGVLPDRLRLFDRLTGAQMLFYAGVLRGLDESTVRTRTADLAAAFGLEEALGRLVSDYSAGMTKKVALAAAMIHSPRILVLDEPFESVDPVSAATITEILRNYAAAGGTVVLSSHSMDLVQRICDHVAVIVGGDLLADGTMAAVRNGRTLEERFVELAGGRKNVEGLEWLHSFSD